MLLHFWYFNEIEEDLKHHIPASVHVSVRTSVQPVSREILESVYQYFLKLDS